MRGGSRASEAAWAISVKAAAAALVAACSLMPGTGAATDSGGSPPWRGEARVELGAGYAGEARYDPLLDLAAVPGGSFVSLTPWGRVRRPVGARGSLAFAGMADLEQYLGDDSRSFLGLAGTVDLILAGRSRLYGRFGLGGQFFDDSEIATARRDGGGGRAALGWAGRRGGVEIGLGAWLRRYPDLVVDVEQGPPETYDETSTVADFIAYRRLTGDMLLRGEVSVRSTDGTGLLYDAASWYARIDAGWDAGGPWSLWLSALAQQRRFDERPAGEDADDYAQVGLRLERALGVGPRLGLQAAWARYGETDGSDDDTWRGGLFLAWRFGSVTIVPANGSGAGFELPEPEVNHDVTVAPGRATFRILAPAAARVAVVGDFNGWDPTRHGLRPVGGGWWQATLELPPASYQYAYVIDGVVTPPPAAPALVDDGFGGRNGLFMVPPPVTSGPESRLNE